MSNQRFHMLQPSEVPGLLNAPAESCKSLVWFETRGPGVISGLLTSDSQPWL